LHERELGRQVGSQEGEALVPAFVPRWGRVAYEALDAALQRALREREGDRREEGVVVETARGLRPREGRDDEPPSRARESDVQEALPLRVAPEAVGRVDARAARPRGRGPAEGD